MSISIISEQQETRKWTDGESFRFVMFWHYCGFAYIFGDVSADILEDSFAVEQITADNISDIRGRITTAFSWKDSEVFLKDGFGFVVRSKVEGNFAAVTFSSAVSPEEVDIGVATDQAYRHHGLASYLAYKMCMEIIQRGEGK